MKVQEFFTASCMTWQISVVLHTLWKSVKGSNLDDLDQYDFQEEMYLTDASR